MRLLTALFLLFSLSSIAQTPSPPAISLQLVSNGWSSPVGIYSCGDDRMFILEQSAGHIEIMDLDGNPIDTFLDVSSLISSGSERGLLGLAFHPDYLNNGTFFINYTDTSGDTVVAKYQVSAGDPNNADPASAQIIIAIDQPLGNHNGGHIAFGPDGYLYIGMGDGGGANDPNNLAQNMQTLLGKMLRIDVDQAMGYSIPPDNPYVGEPELDEIWSSGLRNPWKFSFDAVTGDMWIGDVGQNAWEEIDLEPAGTPGGQNYGWRCYEGDAPFNTAGCGPETDYSFPVATVAHANPFNWCSVTGGVVYRGAAQPNIYGAYFFADYCVGDFYSIVSDGQDSYDVNPALEGQGFGWTAFGEAVNGEIYVTRINGNIYRIVDDCAGFTPMISGTGGQLVVNEGTQAYWYLNGELIPDATGLVYTPVAMGDYYAVVEDGQGCAVQTNALDWVLVSGVPGCTYPSASNFSPDATVDDGTCNFVDLVCAGDIDNNLIVNSADLLLFLASFGTTCD